MRAAQSLTSKDAVEEEPPYRLIQRATTSATATAYAKSSMLLKGIDARDEGLMCPVNMMVPLEDWFRIPRLVGVQAPDRLSWHGKSGEFLSHKRLEGGIIEPVWYQNVSSQAHG